MSRFESNCPECGKSFKNSHVEMRTFCSVGCQADSIQAQAEAARGNGQLSKERSPLAPGEGTWSVFAEKVVRERDEAREHVALLRKALKAYYHECLCQRPGMDEVNKLAYRALRETEPKE